MLKSLQAHIGANMNIKIDYLYCHVDKFSNNCGDASNEQGEVFHQDNKTMENCCHGQ